MRRGWLVIAPRSRVDALVAVALAVVAQVDVWGFGVAGGGTGGALCFGAMAASLAWRRRAPLGVAVLAVALLFAASTFGAPGGASPVLVLWVAFFGVGSMTDRRRAVAGLVLGVVVARFMQDGGFDLNVYLAIALTSFVVPWAVGALWWRRRGARELEARLETTAREAVAAERARLAREIHDVVSHSISMIVVQAAAADVQLRDAPERSREALHEIESGARTALVEMRQMLHLLHPDAPAPLDGIPRLADLDDLVSRVRAAGLRVDLQVDGAPRPASPVVDLAAYRVVQEGLTNVLKHAGPCTATVRVSYLEDLRIVVRDDGRGSDARPAATGFGLTGLGERVHEAGGGLRTSEPPGGGFELDVRLPLGRPS